MRVFLSKETDGCRASVAEVGGSWILGLSKLSAAIAAHRLPGGHEQGPQRAVLQGARPSFEPQ